MELEKLESPHLVGKAAILSICLDSDDKRLKHPYTCRSVRPFTCDLVGKLL